MSQSPAASAAPLPPEEPPAECVGRCGFLIGTGLLVWLAAGEAQILAGRLADDRAAGVEDPRDHGGVDLGHVALDHPAAVHVGHASDADVVLDRDPLARRAGPESAPLDLATPVPGVVGVLIGSRAIAGRARVFDRQARLGELVQTVVGRVPSRRSGRRTSARPHPRGQVRSRSLCGESARGSVLGSSLLPPSWARSPCG